MDKKEDKFDKFDEMGQLPGGYDVFLARETALQHAQGQLSKEKSWLQGLSLEWEIRSARFDEDEDCYKVLLECYPDDADVEAKSQWEYHIDATGKLYPGTPRLISKGTWTIHLPKPVEEEQPHSEKEQKRAEEEKHQIEEHTQQAVHKQQEVKEAAPAEEQQETVIRKIENITQKTGESESERERDPLAGLAATYKSHIQDRESQTPEKPSGIKTIELNGNEEIKKVEGKLLFRGKEKVLNLLRRSWLHIVIVFLLISISYYAFWGIPAVLEFVGILFLSTTVGLINMLLISVLFRSVKSPIRRVITVFMIGLIVNSAVLIGLDVLLELVLRSNTLDWAYFKDVLFISPIEGFVISVVEAILIVTMREKLHVLGVNHVRG